MSQENVEAFKRAIEAFNRRDLEAFLAELDPEVTGRVVLLAMVGGESTAYSGREGAREVYREVQEAFPGFQIEILEIRDLGERVVAIGHLRGHGKASGAGVESPVGYVVEYRNGKAIRIDDFFDPKEALEAAGLSE